MVSKNRANAGGIRGSAVSNDYSGRYMSRQWLGGDRYGQFGDGICQPKPLPLVGYVSMGLFENAPDFSIATLPSACTRRLLSLLGGLVD